MTTRTMLDMSRFSTMALYEGPDGVEHDLSGTIEHLVHEPVRQLQRCSLIQVRSSFGFAVVKPWFTLEDLSNHWDEPEAYVWFVGGWGSERSRYQANAIRKLRPAARLNRDTMMLEYDARQRDGVFQDVVDSETTPGSGAFAWGDFPWGGATYAFLGEQTILSAVSALTQFEDDIIARMLSNWVALELSKIDFPKLHSDD